ncbi:unnamed protein product [Bursaphelenchus okinawaensis]|uniref:Uncharacterized protein n=1 Tax=Bursaphelenchus okinawaensis TaxID=465554 RepID=A0A811LMM7_9BILA|nr:unnamed protein product [Bursaphelenchus okinawaensis]CAG9126888.1 unnamed protein product [Bursaphelenchus okinawaensis]
MICFLIPCQIICVVLLLNCAKKKTSNTQNGAPAATGNNIRPPERKDTMANTDDPNYQTMAIFNENQETPRPPEKGGIAKSNDPNYDTMVIVPDAFGQEK